MEEINRYVETIAKSGYIDKHMRHYLHTPRPEEVRTQQIDFLKKLHKTPIAIRPIVSGSSDPQMTPAGLQPGMRLCEGWVPLAPSSCTAIAQPREPYTEFDAHDTSSSNKDWEPYPEEISCATEATLR